MKVKDFEYNFDNFGAFVKSNKDKLFRMWYKDEEEKGSSLGADYVFIRGCIPIHNDMMLLVRHYDDNYEDYMYPHINFVKLSEILLAYYEDDQDFEDEEDE